MYVLLVVIDVVAFCLLLSVLLSLLWFVVGVAYLVCCCLWLAVLLSFLYVFDVFVCCGCYVLFVVVVVVLICCGFRCVLFEVAVSSFGVVVCARCCSN